MKKIVFLLFFAAFSNASLSKEVDCGIVAEAINSITIEEFYFGYHIEVINIPNGPTVSFWGIDEENAIIKNGLLTNYLISVGYGDVAEKPIVFRIKSNKKLNVYSKKMKTIVFDGVSLKISLMEPVSGLACISFVLNIGEE